MSPCWPHRPAPAGPSYRCGQRPSCGAFLAAVEDDRLYALWLLAASTGMRRGELLGLQWPDVDLGRARVAVRRSLVTVGHKVIVSEPKTAKGRRSVALDPATVAGLKAWHKRQAADLPVIRLHDLRHTHATLALAAGVHPKVVQERLGHANIAITLDTYSHAVPALEEQAARTVAALVFGQ